MVKLFTLRVLMLSCFVAQVATSLTSSTAQTQVLIGFPIFGSQMGLVSLFLLLLAEFCKVRLIEEDEG